MIQIHKLQVQLKYIYKFNFIPKNKRKKNNKIKSNKYNMINKSYRNKRNNASDLSPKCGFRLGTRNKLSAIEI